MGMRHLVNKIIIYYECERRNIKNTSMKLVLNDYKVVTLRGGDLKGSIKSYIN